MLSSVPLAENKEWVAVFEPLPHERETLYNKYGVSEDMLDYAIDPYEKARVEIDREAGITLLIFDVYVPDRESTEPETAPIGIMLTKGNVITFTNAQTNFVNGIFNRELTHLKQEQDGVDEFDLILPVLYQLSTSYFAPIRRADRQRRDLQMTLQKQKRTERKAINNFMELETGLVYILTSLQGNVSLLQEFERRFIDQLNHDQVNMLDDVIVEAQQGLEMAQMTSDVVARVSDSYSTVLDSNLNQTMKFLTVYSIILAIPPIVSGFYGENVKSLPFANSPYAWQITIIITVILILICVAIMFNKRWWK